jgi:predicted nucleic acid-binding protein
LSKQCDLTMRIQRIYIDTSVLGGYFDNEFNVATQRLFNLVKKGEYKVVISNITEGELLNAPERVKTLLNDLSIDYEVLKLTDDVVSLASEYIRENVVGQSSYDDCLHIAIATIFRLDLLVSWNFKHIVNIKRIRGYNGINIKNGYPSIEIRSPKDLIDYEND